MLPVDSEAGYFYSRRGHVFLKSFQITALMLMGFSAAQAQQQPIYWSTTQPDCGSYKSLQLSNGNYVCEVYGIFPWFTAGAGWKTSIRTAAPNSHAIAVVYFYYDGSGKSKALDVNYVGGSGVTSGKTNFGAALYANEPSQLDLLGLPAEAPNYSQTDASGSIVVEFQCPDASTCSQATAQLIYSALPSQLWSLSIPIVWNADLAAVWSSWGFYEKGQQNLSFVISNGANAAQTYKVTVFDSLGNTSTVVTPSIPIGGNYAQVLDTFLGAKIPDGLFKITVAGGGYSAFEALQFNAGSATTLVVFPEGSASLITKDSVTNALPRLSVMDEVVPHIDRRQ